LAISLVFAGFSLPNKAKANFFSSIFGGSASASSVFPEPVFDGNLQNMPLLQANVISSSATSISSNIDINIISETALSPVVVSSGSINVTPSVEDITVYVVKNGDSVGSIAKMFGVTSDTILWANDMKKGDKISEGDVLVILPVSGVKHKVSKGETLSGIARRYNTSISEILSFNGLDGDHKVKIGEEIVIPNAELPEPAKTPAKPSNSNTKPATSPSSSKNTNVSGAYFINPVPSARLTQGLHGALKRGIDLGAPTGTPILASASGTVEIARLGYNGGYGNMVIVRHPNGTKTLYAHMVRLGTTTGAKVEQGQIIGYVGSTGRSTGPHLHFEVHGAPNPGATGAWKRR
jgi:LysM repeat protein